MKLYSAYLQWRRARIESRRLISFYHAGLTPDTTSINHLQIASKGQRFVEARREMWVEQSYAGPVSPYCYCEHRTYERRMILIYDPISDAPAIERWLRALRRKLKSAAL